MKWVWIFFSSLILKIVERIGSSCTIDISGLEKLHTFNEKETVILVCWHHHILVSSLIYNQFIKKNPVVLAAKNGWGNIAARLFKNSKFVLLSTQKKQHIGLKKSISVLRKEPCHALIALDGPIGLGAPQQAKIGAIAIGKKLNLKIVPFSWEASKYWCLPSWDKMRVPSRNSHIHCIFGDPIDVANLTIEEGAQKVTHCLNELESCVSLRASNRF